MRYPWFGAGTSSIRNKCFPSPLTSCLTKLTVPIRYTTEDARSNEQANADDRIRDEVERTGGIWAQMTTEQRAQTLARLRDKKQRAQAARARKQAEQETLEERVAKLEERMHDLEAEAWSRGRVARPAAAGRADVARAGEPRVPPRSARREVRRDLQPLRR